MPLRPEKTVFKFPYSTGTTKMKIRFNISDLYFSILLVSEVDFINGVQITQRFSNYFQENSINYFQSKYFRVGMGNEI